jgi:IS30 family transposase
MHFRRQRDILLTLQERRSRLTLARRLRGKDAELAAEAIAAELGGLPARARRTITHDNGGEFARHEAVTAAVGLDAYFCDPHSPILRDLDECDGSFAALLFPSSPKCARETPWRCAGGIERFGRRTSRTKARSRLL